MKKILVIFTGGTISMERNTSSNASVISKSPEEVLNLINDKWDFDIETKRLFLKPSPHITINDLYILGNLINEESRKDEICGFVITHGTDSLEETAMFLDLFCDTKKPIVITGSMRNISELGYDGPLNLSNSLLVARNKESINRGVLVVFNATINKASEVIKSNTMALDSFKSLDFGPIGMVDSDEVYYTRNSNVKRINLKSENVYNKVEIIKCYLDSDSNYLDYLVKEKIDGIVIEGFGRGNVTEKMCKGIDEAIKANIPIVLTSRCQKGRILDSYGYVGGGKYLREKGVIFAEHLNAQKARIKLILALGVTKEIEKIRKIFKE